MKNVLLGGGGGGAGGYSCTHLHNVLKLVKKELLQPFGHEYDPGLLVGVVTQGVSEHQLHVVPVKSLLWTKMLSFFPLTVLRIRVRDPVPF
jgi:hypothetical protein